MTPDTKALSEMLERVREMAREARQARGTWTGAPLYLAGQTAAFDRVIREISSLSPELAGSNDHD